MYCPLVSPVFYQLQQNWNSAPLGKLPPSIANELNNLNLCNGYSALFQMNQSRNQCLCFSALVVTQSSTLKHYDPSSKCYVWVELSKRVPVPPMKGQQKYATHVEEIVYSMMWLIKPRNITTISTMQIIIWVSIPKESITGWEIKNNINVHFSRATSSGLGLVNVHGTVQDYPCWGLLVD